MQLRTTETIGEERGQQRRRWVLRRQRLPSPGRRNRGRPGRLRDGGCGRRSGRGSGGEGGGGQGPCAAGRRALPARQRGPGEGGGAAEGG